jgi:hypothetical protein
LKAPQFGFRGLSQQSRHQVLIDVDLAIDELFGRPQLIACAHDWFVFIKDMSKQDPSPNGKNRLAFTPAESNAKQNELKLACQHVVL